jgi:hypothetical protein
MNGWMALFQPNWNSAGPNARGIGQIGGTGGELKGHIFCVILRSEWGKGIGAKGKMEGAKLLTNSLVQKYGGMLCLNIFHI